MSELDDYRVEVLVALRRLERVDKDAVTEDERADAEEVCRMCVVAHKCVLAECTVHCRCPSNDRRRGRQRGRQRLIVNNISHFKTIYQLCMPASV